MILNSLLEWLLFLSKILKKRYGCNKESTSISMLIIPSMNEIENSHLSLMELNSSPENIFLFAKTGKK